MDTLPYMPFTNRRDVELPVVDGVVQCDVEQDVLYIAQVERHGKNGNVGKAFMGGFHIRGGAMASSVGHDNHNIIVMGDSFEDMALAVNRCVELGGGQVIVRSGKVAAEVAYPICGLLSDLPLDELAEKKKELNRVAHEMARKSPFPSCSSALSVWRRSLLTPLPTADSLMWCSRRSSTPFWRSWNKTESPKTQLAKEHREEQHEKRFF